MHLTVGLHASVCTVSSATLMPSVTKSGDMSIKYMLTSASDTGEGVACRGVSSRLYTQAVSLFRNEEHS